MASGGDDPGAQDGEPRRMRSGPSQVCSLVRFINTTQRSIDIIWLNYEGIGVVYRTLRPRQYVHVNTFVGHPWIFRDSATGDRMCVQTREVYEPISSVTDAGRARRRLVYITNPLYTLRERCLQEVRRCVPSNRIEHLELPRDILRDLLIRQPDVPILSSTMTSQDRQSAQQSMGSVPSLASLSDPSSASTYVLRRSSPSSSGAPHPSDAQTWASSASDSDVASSSVIPCRSSVPSAAGARDASGVCTNACTSTRSVVSDQHDARHETERSLIQGRRYTSDSDFIDGNQLMNNNNNNDQAMNWNCNNNSSSAINQNIQRSAEVSSSDARQCNGDVTDGSSAVSSSSSRQTITSLRDRLLYQYLECSNGHDIVSSQAVADGNWSNGCASMQVDRGDRSDTSDASACQLSSQSVVDSSSGLSSVASCSSEAARTSAVPKMGRTSGRSSTCTVTSSSEYLVMGSNKAVDEAQCISESEVVVEPMPSSSAVDHLQTGHEVSSIDVTPQSPNSSRIPSSSWDILGNSDSSSTNIDQSLGPCHSNSEPVWHNTRSVVNDIDESSVQFLPDCESSDQNGGRLAGDCTADRRAGCSDDTEQENNMDISGLSDEHQSVNSTSNEGGKHGLSRVNETRLPSKKHRP